VGPQKSPGRRARASGRLAYRAGCSAGHRGGCVSSAQRPALLPEDQRGSALAQSSRSIREPGGAAERCRNNQGGNEEPTYL
jgi:hypothetical protein